MTRTSGVRLASGESIRWRPVLAVVLAGLVGLCGVYLAQAGWSDGRSALARSVDQLLWTQALRGSPAVTDLRSVVSVWREREGASGDRIIERVDHDRDLGRHAASGVAVLDETIGQTLPNATLAEQAAKREPAENVHRAAFDGLGAGDRVTITTTEGRVYAFEVVRPDKDESAGNANEQRIVIRMLTSDGTAADSVMREIKPLGAEQPVVSQPQQDL